MLRRRNRLVLGVTFGVTVGTLAFTAPASAETPTSAPATFTSAFTTMATPDQVLNADSVPTPGQPGATGSFTFRINSDMNVICYDITLAGVTGDYMSPAKTATHIHQAAVGKAGPPRIAFPNPTPVGDGPRTSSGCLQGPFTTGVMANGADTGTGFDLKAIEADAASFAADSHTTGFVAGVVRGQLTQIPVGGVQTGGGGSALAADGGVSNVGIAAAGLALAGLVGAGSVVVYRRRAAQS